VIAAMEAQAFVKRLNQLIDIALKLIPQDSVIYRLMRTCATGTAWSDWRQSPTGIVTHTDMIAMVAIVTLYRTMP